MQAFNNNSNDADNTIIVNGNGQINAIPDVAIIRLGVQTEGENLADIQARNAETSQAVLQALAQYDPDDIRSFQYQINKLYDFTDGRQLDRGYSVRNIFELRTRMMDQLGLIIDTAVASGANIVELIEFEVADSSSYYLEALKLALDNAFQKAYTIADSLGIQRDPVPVKITESSSLSLPPRPFVAREGGVFVTPIEPGSEQIEASVIIDFRF